MSAIRPARRLHLRKTMSSVVNNVRRVARIGNYWYWIAAPELASGIDIAALVSPLRYDVLIRRDFLTFYAAQRDRYAADFDAFVAEVRQGSYYRWFMTSEAIRCKPHLLGDAAALEQEFISRVRRAARLYEDVTAHGFQPQFPIILKTAERLLPPTTDRQGPPTGKHVAGRYFLADGCHRLALLMTLGYTVLPSEYVRVKCFREFSPFDSTALLARSLPIDAKAYFAFLSSRYCAPHVFERKAELLAYVERHRPADLAEVAAVMQVDGFGS
ncbi:MAG TPA: hypothetical protein VFZ66_26090 [Herpetosiphonaceae bacterium]